MSIENFPTFDTVEKSKNEKNEGAPGSELEAGNEKKIGESESDSKDEKKESWFSRNKRKLVLGTTAFGMLSSAVEGKELKNTADEEFAKQNKNEKELFIDSSAEKSAENQIGEVLNIEAEDSDLELRTCSLNQLGFLDEEDFDKKFAEFYKQEKNKYPDISLGDRKGRSIYTEIYLKFINEKIKEKGGSDSFILTSEEWKKVAAEFDRLSNQIPQRSQVGIIIQNTVGGEEITFGVNTAKRDITGKIKIEHFTTNTPMNLSSREMVIKVEKTKVN